MGHVVSICCNPGEQQCGNWFSVDGYDGCDLQNNLVAFVVDNGFLYFDDGGWLQNAKRMRCENFYISCYDWHTLVLASFSTDLAVGWIALCSEFVLDDFYRDFSTMSRV